MFKPSRILGRLFHAKRPFPPDLPLSIGLYAPVSSIGVLAYSVPRVWMLADHWTVKASFDASLPQKGVHHRQTIASRHRRSLRRPRAKNRPRDVDICPMSTPRQHHGITAAASESNGRFKVTVQQDLLLNHFTEHFTY